MTGVRLFAIILGLVALGHVAGGLPLAWLGGSPYYLSAGIVLLLGAILAWRGSRWSSWLLGLHLAAAMVWAVWEAGLHPWALLPRLWLPAALAASALLTPIRRGLQGGPPPTSPALSRAGVAALGIGLALLFVAAAVTYVRIPDVPEIARTRLPEGNGDWPHFGNDPQGTRFSPLADISIHNVKRLKVAWRYSFNGPDPYGLQVTPIKVGDRLYACSSNNLVVALDAATGEELWRFDPEVDLTDVPFRACRAVAYYALPGASGHCTARVYTATADTRIIAVDAHDGRRCADFGDDGEVSMLDGLGPVQKGYYYFNVAPTIARGRIVIGATITDNQYWGEPSGVIRALDAQTGKLAWAYDVGRPDRLGAPEPGEIYTPATPNAWAQLAYDDALGLVYVPTGNATPDYFGAQRRPFDDEIASAVMALDIETGRRVWVFRTTYHDVWDYDVASQPVLMDLPRPDGSVIPVLIQPTKRGEIFMLDRRTGAPVAAVEERPVPTRGAPDEESLSPVQPFSLGIPSLAGEPLRESMMWGLSPFDQMWCRIAFRKARYDGPMTPPGVTPSIQYPGYLGGMNWGSATVDLSRRILVAVTNHVANHVHLVPRAVADAEGAWPMGQGRQGLDALRGTLAQAGTPYGAVTRPFLSPLNMPCQQPPWSRISAIDLDAGRLLWSRPLGTGRENGPMGIKSRLPLTIGVPALGGAITTAGGLTFVGASTDKTFRALDTRTGRILWEANLPESGNATPMTYRAGRDGRQFVVIAAGGHKTLGTKSADDIVAFALDD